jgi:hypothetical protein
LGSMCDNGVMIKPKKLPVDTNERANKIARLLTGEETIEQEPQRSAVSEYLAEIGRRGGLKGGAARAERLSAEKRSSIAKKAAKNRWSSHDES